MVDSLYQSIPVKKISSLASPHHSHVFGSVWMSATSAYVFCLILSFHQYAGRTVPISISLPSYDSTRDTAAKLARLKAVMNKSEPEETLQSDPNGNWGSSSPMCY